MAGKHAEVLLTWMALIEMYTLERALKDLTQEEFDWEPHPGAWGVRRRADCPTPDPYGAADGEWVVDTDLAIVDAAFHGNAVEPMPTIGWLLNHFGAAPAINADLEIVGGPTVPTPDGYQEMWAYTIIPTVEEAVTRFKDGWSALGVALRTTTDEMLERDYEGHPWQRGERAVAAMLNEVSHHGTQICMLRDLFQNRATAPPAD